MNLNVDFLIDFFKKYTTNKSGEIFEDDASAPSSEPAPSSPAPSGGGSTVGAAPSGGGKTPKKWESGLTRGKANQIGNTKWESGRTLGKTYMNDPHYQWSSGRVMGKTGGSDF